jgi:transketolase
MLLVANTIKGKGVSFMEGQPKWHSNWLGGDFLKQALEELS